MGRYALILRAEEDFYKAVELGLFEIDTDGRIWRIAKFSTNGRGDITPCERHRAEIAISTSRSDDYGIVKVIFPGGGVVYAMAHRVVWRHFKGSIPEGLTVNHKDGTKNNNRPDNFELANYSEQKLHAIHVLGRKPDRTNVRIARGEQVGSAKLTENQVREIRAASGWGASRKMAEKFAMSANAIGLIRTRRTWKHVA